MQYVDLATNSDPEGGGGPDLTAEVTQLQDVELRHKRFVIITPAAGSGTLTLPTHVTLTAGYETYVAMYAVDTNTGNMNLGQPIFSTNAPQGQFVPLMVSVNPGDATWLVIDPIVGPVTPADPFGIVYGCKIALKYWDNDATDLTI
jgi:hypothetical protein